jgi:hypothetical protein
MIAFSELFINIGIMAFIACFGTLITDRIF